MVILNTIFSTIENSSNSPNNTNILEFTFFITLILSVIHLWSKQIYHFFYKSEKMVASFSGGMAITYVFVHLLSELEKGQEIIGFSIHFVILLGFILFYGMQRFIWKSKGDINNKHSLLFYTELIFYCLYNFLIIYAIPEQFDNSLALTFLYVLSIGFHLLHNDHGLAEKYPQQFYKLGRYGLIAALFAGLFTDIFTEPANELISDFLVAILAGSIIFNIFSEELPSPENASLRWFIAGVAVYVILLASIWAVK